jgi:hypothetical protein
LLPVPYFHVVFTLPAELRPLALRHQQVLYGLLFKAASQTLLEVSRDPTHLGAQIGCTALLHTWSQTLAYHPHLHCIVTGGGLSSDGTRWVGTGKDFFLPVKVLSRLFRGKLLSFLRQAYTADELILSLQRDIRNGIMCPSGAITVYILNIIDHDSVILWELLDQIRSSIKASVKPSKKYGPSALFYIGFNKFAPVRF